MYFLVLLFSVLRDLMLPMYPLPTLLKHFNCLKHGFNCFIDFKSCPLFTKYLVYSLDLTVSLLQMRRNLRAAPFWIPLIDYFLLQQSAWRYKWESVGLLQTAVVKLFSAIEILKSKKHNDWFPISIVNVRSRFSVLIKLYSSWHFSSVPSHSTRQSHLYWPK